MPYLDPKNDVTFKKVFAEHPAVLISFLNALLPLPDGQQVSRIEYLPADVLPVQPKFKNTIVDIRCVDNTGRHFLVEMQMLWTPLFETRVLYNASKAFSQQGIKGEGYGKLAPVYSLNIVNQLFSQQKAIWYHHYKLTHQKLRRKHLPGMEFVFLELPNFRHPKRLVKREQELWMRFMKDIKNGTTMIASDLLQVPAIAEAVNVLEVSGYSKEELERYDKYWDIVNTQVSFIQDAEARGQKIGEARGEATGEARGSIKTAKIVAVNLLKRGFSVADVAELTGLSTAEVAALQP